MSATSEAAGVTVVIPALNEERFLAPTVEAVLEAGRERPIEVLVVDDGSTDKTGEVASRLAAAHPEVRVLVNPVNRGLGYSYRRALNEAAMPHFMLVPSDNAFAPREIRKVLSLAGTADIIIPYSSNPEVRPWSRRMLSRGYTLLMNLLFGLRIPYYNGIVLHRTETLRRIPFFDDRFAYQSEILVKALRGHGLTWRKVGVELVEQPRKASTSGNVRTLLRSLKAVKRIFREVYFGREEQTAKPSN